SPSGPRGYFGTGRSCPVAVDDHPVPDCRAGEDHFAGREEWSTARLVPVPLRHVLLAVLVSVLWGLNFLAIHASLEQFPPLFLVGLRFVVIAVPTILLVPRPRVRLRWLIGYGLGFGTLQFIGLYLGMAAGFPAGLASLVLQSSAPFTVLLGVLLLRERLTP